MPSVSVLPSLRMPLFVFLAICLVTSTSPPTPTAPRDDQDLVVVEDVPDVTPFLFGDARNLHNTKKGPRERSSSSSSGHKQRPTKKSGASDAKSSQSQDPPHTTHSIDTLHVHSYALVKDFTDMTQGNTAIVDVDVMKELHDRHRDTSQALKEAQEQWKRRAATPRDAKESSNDRALLFETIPNRLQEFHRLSAQHKALHMHIMRTTSDVLGNHLEAWYRNVLPRSGVMARLFETSTSSSSSSQHAALLRYCDSRVRQDRFASQRNIGEMLASQREIRSAWYLGLTLREHLQMSATLAVYTVVLGMMRGVAHAIYGGKKRHALGKVQRVVVDLCDNRRVLFPLLTVFFVLVEMRVMAVGGVGISKQQTAAVCVLQFVVVYATDFILSKLIWAAVRLWRRTTAKSRGRSLRD